MALILVSQIPLAGQATASVWKRDSPHDQERLLSVHFKNELLADVLHKLARKVKVGISYETEMVPSKQISYQVKNRSIFKILSAVLKNTGLEATLSENRKVILIKKKKKILQKQVVVQSTITGTVTDSETGETLPGVNILVKGTSIGASTNANGQYKLTVESLQDTLVVSFVGYKTQRVPIIGRTEINVSLQAQAITGEEMVVVGYGTQQKSDLTGAVSQVTSEDFNAGTQSSPSQLISGKVPGVTIDQTSSEPGGGTSVRIRGSSSINAGNSPLYVIDGLPIDNSPLLSAGGAAGVSVNQNPRNPLNSINPNNIESIEILKDASATAIYGSRGSNGVILITTKRGNKNKFSVQYGLDIGIQIPTKMNVLSPSQYVDVLNGISEDAGNGPVFTESDINKMGNGTNWQDEIYKNALLNNHNLSLSGGTDNNTYFMSLNYYDQPGVLKQTGIKKYIGRINFTQDLGDHFQAGLRLNYSRTDNNNSIDGVNNNERGGPIYASLLFDPTAPIYNSNGAFYRSPNLTVNNPVSLIDGISSKSKVERNIANIFVNYDLSHALSAKLRFGWDSQSSRRDIYNSRLTILGDQTNGQANIATLERTDQLYEGTLKYEKQLNENNYLNVLAGVTYEDYDNTSFSGDISNFPTDDIGTNNLSLGDTGEDNLFSNRNEHSLLSYLGRINYTLLDEFLITATFRADGSSRFGENNQYGYFPSAAIGWKLSERDFVPELFNNLKLRFSWGLTGNQEGIGNYAYSPTFSDVSGGYGPGNPVLGNSTVLGLRATRIPNPDLKWETTEQYDLGIDAGLLEGRINFTADYFVKNTTDLLINLPVSISTGFGSILSNIGEVQNRGFEFQVKTINISNQFNWSTTFNFSTLYNEVQDLGGAGDIFTGKPGSGGIGNTAIIREGESSFSYYGYKVTGIFQTDDDISGSSQPNGKPGDPIFQDTNEDGTISPLDKVIIGNPRPDYTFGLQNDFAFKGFQLGIYIQAQVGNDLMNANLIQSLYPANFRRNRLSEPALNRWTPDNPDTKWPSNVNPSSYAGGNVNSLSLLDASYVRLKNVRFSYDVPNSIIGPLESMRVSIVGQNLITLTDYIGSNPEASAFGRSDARIDYSSYPLTRIIELGLDVGF